MGGGGCMDHTTPACCTLHRKGLVDVLHKRAEKATAFKTRCWAECACVCVCWRRQMRARVCSAKAFATETPILGVLWLTRERDEMQQKRAEKMRMILCGFTAYHMVKCKSLFACCPCELQTNLLPRVQVQRVRGRVRMCDVCVRVCLFD